VVPAAPVRRSTVEPTFRLANSKLRVTASPSDVAATRFLLQSSKKPAQYPSGIRDRLQRKLLRMPTIVLFVCSVGWCWPVLSELRSLISVSPAAASIHPHGSYCHRLNRCRGKADSEIEKLDPFNSAIYAPSTARHVTRRSDTRLGRKSAARIVARERSGARTRFARHSGAAAVKHAANGPKSNLRPPVRLASLEGAAPPVEANRSHIPSDVGALTSLVDFETAPFPYHGSVPNSGQPFLNAGAEGHWGHVNFRGNVLWEFQTFGDDRVLLHIPPGFDPKRPAVMVVFFHGHGANLAQDVRDRQQVPAQITAAGVNAVLVAPQFAFNAADSSAGKFWEPNGFQRFLESGR
jgi:hypothetical protein